MDASDAGGQKVEMKGYSGIFYKLYMYSLTYLRNKCDTRVHSTFIILC